MNLYLAQNFLERVLLPNEDDLSFKTHKKYRQELVCSFSLWKNE